MAAHTARPRAPRQILLCLPRAARNPCSRHRTNSPSPPPELNLDGLCQWEVQQAALLSPEVLAAPLTYSGARMSVAELLRLNARHTVWHAGQIAALSSGPKLA